jgi:hypothetical protein
MPNDSKESLSLETKLNTSEMKHLSVSPKYDNDIAKKIEILKSSLPFFNVSKLW